MPRKKPKADALLLDVGLDAPFDSTDGHKRITKARDALLVGGSEDTHLEMREKVVKFNEELDRRGMRLGDVRCAEELREIAARAGIIEE